MTRKWLNSLLLTPVVTLIVMLGTVSSRHSNRLFDQLGSYGNIQRRSDESAVFCRNGVRIIVRCHSSEIDTVRINMDSQGGKTLEVRLHDDILLNCSMRRREYLLIPTEWPNKQRYENAWGIMNSDNERGLNLLKKTIQTLDLELIKTMNSLNF